MRRKRPRKPSQMDRFRRNPERLDRSVCRRLANGWGGGRSRHKPTGISLHFARCGVWIGGVMQYGPGSRWIAYDARTEEEQPFWHRRDAKRWVEAR